MKFLARVFLLIIGLSACLPLSPATHRYKLVVTTNGMHRLTAADLRAAGIPIERIDASTWQLYHNDQEVALDVNSTGNNLTLDFYAQASDSPYSVFNSYWLTWGEQPGKRMRAVAVPPSTWLPTTSFTASLDFAPVHLYAPQPAELGESWFWQSLAAPITTTIPITLTAVIIDPARVRLNLWGNSDDVVKPNHHVRVLFNETIVADERWSGRGNHSFGVVLPAMTLRTDENNLQLVLPGDTSAIADAVLLQSIEVMYSRRLMAQADALEFAGGPGTYRVEGFSNDVIELYDITNPSEPFHIVNPDIKAGTVQFGIDDVGLHRWLAIGSSRQRWVPQIIPMLPTNLRSITNQADYVVITHRDLAYALQPLIDWRSKRGLKTIVVTTDQIYDEFNFGIESPLALRAFLDYAQHEWRKPSPRFVLLVGKASYDYRNNLKGANKNLVPTILVDTLNEAQVASDNQFVAASSVDIRPTMAIGRIPANTGDQVTQIVSKIIQFESNAQDADWRKRAILVVDDKSPEFAAMANVLAARLPSTMQTDKIFLAEMRQDARAQLIARWNVGASILVYVGHGSVDLWSSASFFGSTQVNQVQNGNRLPILFTPTCLDGFFYHPFADSLAERLLFKSDGGIIAGVVPTGVSFSSAQNDLMNAIFAQLFENRAQTLGEAFTRGKQELDASSPTLREVTESFVLLGDPALELGW